MLKRISAFLAGSVVAQGLAAATGLLLAHWLPVHDYAIYTIMILITGAMTLLTKGGTHLGYTTLLARDWPDPFKVDALGKAAKQVRTQVSLFVLPPITLVSAFLLIRADATWIQVLVLTTLLILSWRFDMQTRVVDQVLFFAKQTTKVQILDTALGGIRLAAIALAYAAHFLSATFAISASVAVAALRVRPILTWIRTLAPPSMTEPASADVSLVRRVALRQLPIELFTVFQTQIILIILSLVAHGANVANYGALTRISQLLLPIQALSYAFLIPSFSQVRTNVLRSLIVYTLICAGPSCGLVLLTWCLPEYVLLLIGPNYAGLNHELFITAVNAALYSTAGIFWNLAAHRGWNKYAWLQIVIGVGWCISAPLFLPLDTLAGVLWLQAGFAFGYFVAACADVGAAMRRKEI
jgi:O-antigen/teichoic acid export membrane protein